MRGQNAALGRISHYKKTLDCSRVTIMLCLLGYCADVLSPEFQVTEVASQQFKVLSY
jgi:hypothetical protein